MRFPSTSAGGNAPSPEATATIGVAWRMGDPPAAAVRWYPWPATSMPPSPAPATDGPLEATLGWPAGTLEALRQAFAAKLPRTTGWDATATASAHASALASAARVFKRGVPYRTSDNVPTARTLAGRYDVTIVHDKTMPPALLADAAFYVVDANVARAWPQLAALSSREASTLHVVALDEHHKTLDSVAAMIAAWRVHGALSHWVTIGGGVLTDVAAFAASLIGASIAFVPTTLLAMADACVGGKTGVNFAPYGKNQIGRFYFPTAVRIWTGWLATLPPRELRAGSAEALKHAFLMGDVTMAETLAAAVAATDLTALAAALPAVIHLKTVVVEEDPAEIGRRAILNLGHTLAHALEGVSQARTVEPTTLLHGEAVGLGMAFALLLSQQVCGMDAVAVDAAWAQLRRAGCLMDRAALQQRLGADSATALDAPATFAAIATYIGQDKKNVAADDATTQWVLLSALGTVARGTNGAWTCAVPLATVAACWHEFLRRL